MLFKLHFELIKKKAHAYSNFCLESSLFTAHAPIRLLVNALEDSKLKIRHKHKEAPQICNAQFGALVNLGNINKPSKAPGKLQERLEVT